MLDRFQHSFRPAYSVLFLVFIGLCFIGLSLLATSANANDIVRGEKLSQTCLGCHGAPLRNPSPVYSIPKVGGQHSEYIISALQAYKAKTRSHGTMQAQASNLSDQDMADIAAYFNSIGDNSQPNNVNARLAEQGQKESATCSDCHGEKGDGEDLTFPKLAGQYESYITHALKGYRSGERQNPIMAIYAEKLTIHQIKALSAWFASQEGGLSAPEITVRK